MPPTHIISWGSPAACSAVTGAMAVIILPLAFEGVTELAVPLLCFQPWSGVSGGPFEKSEGSLCRGCRCFVRAMFCNIAGGRKESYRRIFNGKKSSCALSVCQGRNISTCNLKLRRLQCVQISNASRTLGISLSEAAWQGRISVQSSYS